MAIGKPLWELDGRGDHVMERPYYGPDALAAVKTPLRQDIKLRDMALRHAIALVGPGMPTKDRAAMVVEMAAVIGCFLRGDEG